MRNCVINCDPLIATLICLCAFPVSCARTTVDGANPINNEIPAQVTPKSEAVEGTMTAQLIFQMTLDLPELQQYFHPTEPSRKPLRVIKNVAVKAGMKLTKFDLPVEFITLSEARKRKKPYFEFTSIEIKEKTASVSFRYRVEGIRGKVNFERNGAWQVVSHELVEE